MRWSRNRGAGAPQLAALAAVTACCAFLLPRAFPRVPSFALAPTLQGSVADQLIDGRRPAGSSRSSKAVYRIQTPVPWNMAQEMRLRKQIGYINCNLLKKDSKRTIDHWQVLDAAQYLDSDDVKEVLLSFQIRHEKVENPTEWVVGRLRLRTQSKLAPPHLQWTEEKRQKVRRTVAWVNGNCELEPRIFYNTVVAAAMELPQTVVSRILNRVHLLVNRLGNEEVAEDAEEYVLYTIDKYRKDGQQIKRWADWHNEHGGLKSRIDKTALMILYGQLERTSFWKAMVTCEEGLAEAEDPNEYLKLKLLVPAEIQRISQEHFRGEVDVDAVLEAVSDMTLDQAMDVLEEAEQRRWEIQSNPTGFLLALVEEARESRGAYDEDDVAEDEK